MFQEQGILRMHVLCSPRMKKDDVLRLQNVFLIFEWNCLELFAIMYTLRYFREQCHFREWNIWLTCSTALTQRFISRYIHNIHWPSMHSARVNESKIILEEADFVKKTPGKNNRKTKKNKRNPIKARNWFEKRLSGLIG